DVLPARQAEQVRLASGQQAGAKLVGDLDLMDWLPARGHAEAQQMPGWVSDREGPAGGREYLGHRVAVESHRADPWPEPARCELVEQLDAARYRVPARGDVTQVVIDRRRDDHLPGRQAEPLRPDDSHRRGAELVLIPDSRLLRGRRDSEAQQVRGTVDDLGY